MLWEEFLCAALNTGGIPVLRCGFVLGFCSVALLWAAHAGGFTVVV